MKCKWPSTIHPIPSSYLADKEKSKREHGLTKNTTLLDVPHTPFLAGCGQGKVLRSWL